ncbi:uncharacterized protein LOC132615858 [Lycium barbarum]|uniref:uncharacterized protein LOC132615858 n=1 Tax=Lycium barbarum TaxID=112863 RepID=UPI00293E419F|nr:uncharacterized protein LOC132615858 [Lycium barbarum]
MASYNENWSDGSYAYFDDPCLYCGGPHSWQNCLNSPGGVWCAQSQTYEWSICDRCGGQNGHWDNCAYLSFPPPNPHYDYSSFDFDDSRDMEVEEASNAQNERIMLMLETILEKVEKQDLAVKDLRQAINCNDKAIHTLEDQMKLLAQIHNAQQLEDVESRQESGQNMNFSKGGFLQALNNPQLEESLDKVEVVSQDWLMTQAQQLGAYGDHREGISRMMEFFFKIHVEQSQELKELEIAIRDLNTKLNAKVEVCNTQHQIVMESSFQLVSNEKVVNIDFQELMMNCQPTNPKIMQDANIEEMILELHKKVHEMVFEDSSSFLGEDVKNEANLKLKRIGPHSNHFSTLCLVDDMEVELTEPMENCGNEEESVFILKFAMPKRQNGMPHLRAKKCKMRTRELAYLFFYHRPMSVIMILIQSWGANSYLPNGRKSGKGNRRAATLNQALGGR